jgi:parvulin-like peptidyl-prolyl isomerase
VLTNNPSGTYSVKKLAAELMSKLDDKVPFAELAKVYSQDSYAAAGGGRGWLQKSQMRKDLADVAFTLEPGQQSLVETADAFYIIQVDEKKVSYTQTLSEVRDDIEATLKAEENKRLRKQWIEGLKAKAFVRYF